MRRDFLPNLRDKRGITERKQFEGSLRDCLDKMCVYMAVGVSVARARAAVSSKICGLSLEG